MLRTLERAFAHHAGSDARLDLEDLRRALGLKSDYLTRRIFAAFDRNADGQVSREEFVEGVRALTLGTRRDKLAFAFRLWDHDGDGFLSREELLRMIALSFAENDVEERLNQPSEQLANALFLRADRDRDGRVSFEELLAVAEQHPELLERMTRHEAIWIAPNEELLLLLDERAGLRRQPSSGWFANHTQQLAFLALWLGSNAGVLAWSLFVGRSSQTSDPAMQLGRALGACLDLNAAFVLLPVMRRLMGWVRRRALGRVLPIDDAVDFHKLVGHTLFGLSVVHSAAFMWAYTQGHPTSAAWGVLTSERGLTGALLLGVFLVIWLGAQSIIRRSKRFELFYFTHLAYLPWLALLVAHAPRILLFSGFAIVAFVVEHLLRLRRRRPASRVLSATALRSGVARLEIERPAGFEFGAGDYVFLRLPAIARHEWHPFTISSAPEAATLSFHVRSLGNWTSALRRYVEAGPQPLTAFVDGPYGTPSARIFQARFAVLIGAGIGVTPFASVLESLVLRSGDSRACALEKLHFFWINGDQYSFEWFRELLAEVESRDTHRLLDIHLCMTRVRSGVTAFGLELARDVMQAAGRSDFMTGLRTKTHLGPPDWEALLGAIADRHRPALVDVFFCGPHGLSKKLAPLCARLGMRYREERF